MSLSNGPIQHVGYLGTGIMGAAMARNLLASGNYRLTVSNRTPHKADSLVAQGATFVESPALLAAAQPDVLFLNVTDTADVEQVLFGDDDANNGIMQSAQPGLIVVDNSTICPIQTKAFAKRLAEVDIQMLDAPVSGGDVGARNGTLSIMVGGPAAAFQRCLPLLQLLGKSIVHLGESGAGQACKACNQVAVSTALLGACEALAMAKKFGLDLSQMIEVVSGGAAGSWQLANLGPKIAQGDYTPGFMIDLLLKDLRLVSEAGTELGLPMTITRQVQSFFQTASAAGHGKDGTQAVATVIETQGEFRFSE